MNLVHCMKNSAELSNPPPGSINVLLGKKVEGPGGKWVPCATKVADGSYYSGLFQVGPGQRQVCASSMPLHCPAEALSRAIVLAAAAAA
jgi:hypothetical protein